MRPTRGRPHTHELRIHPGFERDLQDLYQNSRGDRSSFEGRLLTRTLNMVRGLRTGYPSTHSLVQLSDYPDLSDCETTYVGVEPDEKPSHRLVWRELPPAHSGGLPVREVLGFGERQYGAVYHQIGPRLGRPRGVSLAELEAMPEPVKPGLSAAVPKQQQWHPGPRGGEHLQRPIDKYPQLREEKVTDASDNEPAVTDLETDGLSM